MVSLLASLAWLSSNPVYANTLCGMDFQSPQQLEADIATKIGEPPDVRDPQYQAYFDNQNNVAWAFTTQKNPAHPAVVCRMIVQKNADVVVDMQARCGNTQEACDTMMEAWKKLSERMQKELKKN